MNFYDLEFSKSLIAIQVLMRKDNEGNTPFHLAAASGDIETLDNFILYYELEIGNIEENPGKYNFLIYIIQSVVHKFIYLIVHAAMLTSCVLLRVYHFFIVWRDKRAMGLWSSLLLQ